MKLSSFGSFVVRKKGERVGRNPKTGEEVPISPRRVMVFKPSNVLKQKINETLINGTGRSTGMVADDDRTTTDSRRGRWQLLQRSLPHGLRW